jgi:hypothetical protein
MTISYDDFVATTSARVLVALMSESRSLAADSGTVEAAVESAVTLANELVNAGYLLPLS